MNNLLFPLLILFTSVSFCQQQPTQQINIPFSLSSNGHIVIQAKVNGTEGSFIFDTGAGLNLLTKDFADRLSDLEETQHFHTGHRATGEEIQSVLWNSRSLEINGFIVKNERFTVYDIEFPLDGLISLTPFLDTPITIDFEKKMLSIESRGSLKERISQADFQMPIKIANDKGRTISIATEIQLENRLNLLVNLDSGAGFDVYRFNSKYLTDLGIDSTKLKSEYRKSYFQPEEGNTFYFTSLSRMSDENNNTAVENFKATFIDGLIHEGIMGINWIGKKITIDIPGKRLLVQK